MRSRLVAAFAFTIATLWASAYAGAVPIDIVSRTSLDLRTHAVGREIVVTGRVSDDLGLGLRFRRVRIEGRSEHGEFSVEAMTDARGAFRVNRIVSPADWTISGRFVGDLFTDADEVEDTIAVRDRPPRVAFSVPAIVPVSEPTAPLAVQVTVGGRPGLGAAVTFESDCGQVAGGAAVGPDGVARADFRFEHGATGVCAIEARVTGQRRFGPASAFAEMRRIESPTVRASGEFERGVPFVEGQWTIRVEAFDRFGSLEGARVEVDRDGVVLGAAVLPASGVVAIVLAESVIGAESSIIATLVPDVGDLRLSTSGLVLVRPSSPSQVFGSLSTGLALLLGLVILGGLVREIRRSRPRAGSTKPVVAGVGAERGEEEIDGVIVVVVRDVEDSLPLVATIKLVATGEVLTSGADGLVHFESAPQIDFEAHASAYVPLKGTITRPPRGRRAVIRLKSVRAEVRDVLRDVIDRVHGERTRWWGRITVRSASEEALKQARMLRLPPRRESTHRAEFARLLLAASAQRGDAEALEALTLLVDDMYFGGGGDFSAVELARELADATRGLE
jgi:hypothetical protein